MKSIYHIYIHSQIKKNLLKEKHLHKYYDSPPWAKNRMQLSVGIQSNQSVGIVIRANLSRISCIQPTRNFSISAFSDLKLRLVAWFNKSSSLES